MGTINLKKQTLKCGLEAVNGKTYVKATQYSKISFKDLVKDIQDHTGVPMAMVKATIDAMAHEVLDNVKNGHSVAIDGLGSFYLSTSAKAQADAEKANSSTVRRVALAFRQSTEVKNDLLNKSTGVRFDTLETSADKTPDDSGNGGNNGGNNGGSGDGGEYNENDGID